MKIRQMSCLKKARTLTIVLYDLWYRSNLVYKQYLKLIRDAAIITEKMLLWMWFFLLASYDKWEVVVLSWFLCNRLFITQAGGALEVWARQVNKFLMRWQPETLHLHHRLPASGTFYRHGLTFIPAWISNHMPSKVWVEITYPFQNFSGNR